MDKLDAIFTMQAALDEEIIARRNLQHIEPQEWIQKEVLALIDELSEVLNEVNYKWWKTPKQIDETALKEELVDVLHFFVSMCLKAGMTSRELHDIYMEKNKENFDRQRGLSNKPGYAVSEEFIQP